MADDLWSKFERYHFDNPHVWKLFVKFANESRASGLKKYSSDAILHRIRWHVVIDTKSADEFKISNNWSAYYARLYMHIYPSTKGFFNLKPINENPEVERRVVLRTKFPGLKMNESHPGQMNLEGL